MPAPTFELVSHGGKPVTTINEWRSGLNKREQTKFQPDFSAYETARAWTEPTRIPPAIAALFDQPPLAGFRPHRAIVEATTRFDMLGEPRHHDVLLFLQSDAGRMVVVGVESKVNEDFGATVEKEHDRALARAKTAAQSKNTADYKTNMPTRLRALSEALLGRELSASAAYDPRDAKLAYQLLSALAGTLVEAAKPDVEAGVLLIHEFQTQRSRKDVEERSSARIHDLLTRFGRPPAEPFPTGRLVGPFVAPGGGMIPSDKPFYVAKVRTVVDSGTSS